MTAQALSGIRVLDVTHHIAGPYATKLLADFGAEVIKVERTGQGDPARRMGPFFKDDPHPEKSGLFLNLNTSKKGVTLNLKSKAGVGLFLELAKQCHAVVESFRPGVMERLGLGWDALEKVNPRLVFTRLSSFGQTGPYRGFKSTELVSLAMGSPMYRMGEPDREPVKFAGNSGQYLAGCYAAAATLGALYGARLRGKGGTVDVSMMESFINWAGRYMVMYIYSREVPGRLGYRREGMYPHGYFPTSDGYAGISASYLRHWPRVVRLLNMPELLEDPRFKTPAARMQHHDDFDAIWYPWLMDRTKQEIFHACQEHHCPAGPVYNTADLVQDPHYKIRGFFTDIEHPMTGVVTYPGAPFKMARTPWRTGRAPLLGEHNQEVYEGLLGHSGDDLAKLKERGVI
ncbi:MAG: CoA transferase [Chloroflexota bacterium]|nr:CoA transferase [Chloroflexota bacterium]